MTHEQFIKFQDQLHKEIYDIGDTKGKEYAHSNDRFANFRRLADQLNLKDYQVGWVYATKHIDSIISYIKEGKIFSEESIRGRFKDAILYFELILAMIEEENAVKAAKVEKLMKGDKTVASNLDLTACAKCNHIFATNELIYQHPDKRSNEYYCSSCIYKIQGGLQTNL